MRKRFITLAVLLLSCGLVWPAGVPSEGLGIDIITVVIHTVREPGTLALIGIGLAGFWVWHRVWMHRRKPRGPLAPGEAGARDDHVRPPVPNH